MLTFLGQTQDFIHLLQLNHLLKNYEDRVYPLGSKGWRSKTITHDMVTQQSINYVS